MTKHCEKHDLVLAADGKCVLCRREQTSFVYVDSEYRSTFDRLVTAAMGAGLVAAMGVLIWTVNLPAPDTGPKYIVNQTDGDHSGQPPPDWRPARITVQEPKTSVPTPAMAATTAKPIATSHNDPARASLRAARAAVEEAKRSVKITMYSTSWCTICETSRYYLEGRELLFDELDIEREPSARVKMNRLNRLGSVPTFVIANEVLVGFNPWQLEEMLAREARKQVSLTCDADRCQGAERAAAGGASKNSQSIKNDRHAPETAPTRPQVKSKKSGVP